MSSFFDPLISFDLISQDELNDCLVRWNHQMGPLTRPVEYGFWAHGLKHNGVLVAVAAASALIRENCGGMDWLDRSEAVELSRVCAARPHLCRPVVRLWREFAFPALCQGRGYSWAVSYQDAVLHGGDLYRFDGWTRLKDVRSGSTDPRTSRPGRKRVIWGWHADPTTRAAGAVRALRKEAA